MKSFLYVCIISLCTHFLYAQTFSSKVYFSEQIASYINVYQYKIGKAKAARDYQKVADLYNEFINQKLVGSYLDDFNIDCFDRKKNNLGDFDKPLVLLTYADWCKSLENEIFIFNRKVEELHKKIDFLVLLWGDKRQARKLKKLFHNKSKILYVNALRNRDEHTIRMLKHALGVPTIIMTNADKKIKSIIKVTPAFPNLYEYDFEKELVRNLKTLNID